MSHIFLLLGVSGSGKTTLLHELISEHKDTFVYVPSYTTRACRAGEVNGQKYRHISQDEFQASLNKNEFLEWAHSTSTDDRYGSKYADLVDPLAHGKHTIKEIDLQGLQKVLDDGRISDKLTTIFLNISDEVITQRLTSRGSEDEIANRISTAQQERENMGLCDHVVDASRPLEQVKKDFFTLLGL